MSAELDEPSDAEREAGGQVQSTTKTRSRGRLTIVIGTLAIAAVLLGVLVGVTIGRSNETDAAADLNPGVVDVGFLQDMSVHHEQAITMGGWARDHASDPAVRRFGSLIAGDQEVEIDTMETLLRWWDKPARSRGEPMAWMSAKHDHHAMGNRDSHGQHDPPMPGMATDKELQKMRALHGVKLDVYFLQLMLRHHQGGAPMAQFAADNANSPIVRRLALSMLASQGAESRLIQRMLADRNARPLPF